MEAAHSFRILLKNQLTVKKAKGKAAAPPPPEIPTLGTIWVAKQFPPWQSTVLTSMKQLFEVIG